MDATHGCVISSLEGQNHIALGYPWGHSVTLSASNVNEDTLFQPDGLLRAIKEISMRT